MKEVHKLTGRMTSLSRSISPLSDKSHSFFEALKDFKWDKKFENSLIDLKEYLTTPPMLSKH